MRRKSDKVKRVTFTPFLAQCSHCKGLIPLFRERYYGSCPCGVTSVDAGDGLYMRLNLKDGNPLPTYYTWSKVIKAFIHDTRPNENQPPTN